MVEHTKRLCTKVKNFVSWCHNWKNQMCDITLMDIYQEMKKPSDIVVMKRLRPRHKVISTIEFNKRRKDIKILISEKLGFDTVRDLNFLIII